MSGFLNQVWLVLVLAVGLGSSLAAIDRSLQPRIAANAEARLREAVLEVVPQGNQFSEQRLADRTVYRVTDGTGQLVGWAVPAKTMGFADTVRMIIGVAADGQSILGLVILDSRETPGLGDNIRTGGFREQFSGLPTAATIQVIKPGQTAEHSVDALTGATISSRAVTNGVNQTMHDVRQVLAASVTAPGEDPTDE